MAGIKNPIIYDIASEVTTAFDSKVEELRAALANLSWLERSFGRSYRMPKYRTDARVILPHVWIGNDEYQPMEPNDAIKSMSFIVGDDEAFTPLDDVVPYSQINRWTKPIRIIFFVDYKRLFEQDGIGGQYPFSEILLEQVQNILWRFSGFVMTGYVSETITDVYEGFDLSEVEQSLLFYPYGAFRINGEMSFEVNCLP